MTEVERREAAWDAYYLAFGPLIPPTQGEFDAHTAAYKRLVKTNIADPELWAEVDKHLRAMAEPQIAKGRVAWAAYDSVMEQA